MIWNKTRSEDKDVPIRVTLIDQDATLEAARVSAHGQTRAATIATAACVAAALITVAGMWLNANGQQPRTQPGPTATVTITRTPGQLEPLTHMT